MQEIRDEAEQPQAAGEDDELILRTQLREEVLLVLLDTTSLANALDVMEQQVGHTKGKDSFTGGPGRSGGMRSDGRRVRVGAGARRLEERRVVTWY